MRIFLIGFMGVGKSTLGQVLAERLHRPFIDLDEWIEDKMEMPISEIFSNYGELFFRKLEHENLQEVIERYDRFVMGTGGGLPCFGNNISKMNKSGICIYLKASADEISARLAHSSGKRPILDAMGKDQRKQHIAGLLNEREAKYNEAQLVVPLALDREKEENVSLLQEYLQQYLEGDLA
ncbi:MAG: shikimate kinase [Saprospiraceae bacterium]|nr:shikimate kinase [Saprospiraceae bacterium]